MSYRYVFSAEADADFLKMPPLVASSLLDGLDALRACPDPYVALVPGHFPYRVSWLFRHRCSVDGDRWICNVNVVPNRVGRFIDVAWIHCQQIPDYDWEV